jgi:hypothetical protein
MKLGRRKALRIVVVKAYAARLEEVTSVIDSRDLSKLIYERLYSVSEASLLPQIISLQTLIHLFQLQRDGSSFG